jgi:hypothetical protein
MVEVKGDSQKGGRIIMEQKIAVSLKTDDKGLLGRECPECERYFKMKVIRDLNTAECICPYCECKDSHDRFFTQDQIEYMKSYAVHEVIAPEFRKLERTIRNLEHSTRGGLIQIKVSTSGMNFPLKYYRERDLETPVTCDSCGLEFAIYGVFASCPECGRLNALTIIRKSIEVARKKLLVFDHQDAAEVDVKNGMLAGVLSDAVSSFDAFGKALRLRYPGVFPDQPRNLFQNLSALSGSLENGLGSSLQAMVGNEQYDLMSLWFQVRHLYEHNMGVVDEDFVRKVKGSGHLRGKKHPLERKEIEKVLEIVQEAAEKIMTLAGQHK